jgi:uroporphyrinogen decarboxylase
MSEQKKPRQDTMSYEERMGALMMGQRPDRVPCMPFAVGVCAKTVGMPIARMYDDAEKSFWAQMWTWEMYGYDAFPMFGYASYGGWEFGGDIKMPEGEFAQAPVVSRFPAQTPEEVDALEIPDPATAGQLPLYMKFLKILHQFGAPIMVMAWAPFTAAGNTCEVDVLCRWMIKQPDVAHKLLRKCTDFSKKIADHIMDSFPGATFSGATACATSANQIISPRQFKEFVLPYHKEVHEHLMSRGINSIFCHICGEQNLNLPYWQQIPFGDRGILSFGHEVDLTKAIEMFGDKHIIAGNIEPQVIQNRPWQEVYELCRVAIEKAKYAPNGYVLMAGCEIPVQAPPYNIYVMKKAVMEFGFYD